jgi:hypothetical protein
MKLSEYKETFYTFSGKASDNGRNAAYAGIAAVWVFKQDSPLANALPRALILPLICFVIAIACDVLQYIVQSVTYWGFHYYHEQRLNNVAEDDPELSHPNWFNHLPTAFYFGKFLFLAVGYVSLGGFLWDAWTKVK